jgi:hypothetical protein
MRKLFDNMWLFALLLLFVSMTLSTALYVFYMAGRM